MVLSFGSAELQITFLLHYDYVRDQIALQSDSHSPFFITIKQFAVDLLLFCSYEV